MRSVIILLMSLCVTAVAAQRPVQPIVPRPLLPLVPTVPQLSRTTLPSPYSYQQLGVFCKLDVQLERHTRFPVLIRLGDVQQVEAWEGKGPLRSPR
jgi:hypothetical protein